MPRWKYKHGMLLINYNIGCCDQSKADQFYIDNQPKRQQGLCVLSEWSVVSLQPNVDVSVLYPTLLLKAPVISEAHTANLIIQAKPSTWLQTVCFLNCNYVYCNGEKLWLKRKRSLCSASDRWCMQRWITTEKCIVLTMKVIYRASWQWL